MTTTRNLLSMVVLAAAAVAAPAMAQSDADTYNRVVLGHGSVTSTSNSKAVADNAVVAGSYAQYLIVNGTHKADALRQAARIGEQPSAHRVSNVQPQLSAYQLYERVQGRNS